MGSKFHTYVKFFFKSLKNYNKPGLVSFVICHIVYNVLCFLFFKEPPVTNKLPVKLISPNTDLLEDICEVSIDDLRTLADLRDVLTSTSSGLSGKCFGFLNKELKFIYPQREGEINLASVFSSQIRIKLFEDEGLFTHRIIIILRSDCMYACCMYLGMILFFFRSLSCF